MCRGHLEEFDATNLVTALHRLARHKGGRGSDLSVERRMVGLLAERSAELRVRHLSSTAWSLSTLSIHDQPLMDAIA